MRLPRFVHRFLAWLGGWFWLPCPVCGEWFAGYEAGDYDLVDPDEPWRCWVICRRHDHDYCPGLIVPPGHRVGFGCDGRPVIYGFATGNSAPDTLRRS